jgi:hypothetical protein
VRDSDRIRKPGPGFWVRFLAFLMAIWAPLAFALEASASVGRLLTYGTPAILLLLYRVGTTGLGIAAGRALWMVRPGAPVLARAWLVLDALATTLALLTPYFPSNRVPGTKGPVLALLLAVNAAWLLFLSRSRRVQALWPSGASN